MAEKLGTRNGRGKAGMGGGSATLDDKVEPVDTTQGTLATAWSDSKVCLLGHGDSSQGLTAESQTLNEE